MFDITPWKNLINDLTLEEFRTILTALDRFTAPIWHNNNVIILKDRIPENILLFNIRESRVSKLNERKKYELYKFLSEKKYAFPIFLMQIVKLFKSADDFIDFYSDLAPFNLCFYNNEVFQENTIWSDFYKFIANYNANKIKNVERPIFVLDYMIGAFLNSPQLTKELYLFIEIQFGTEKLMNTSPTYNLTLSSFIGWKLFQKDEPFPIEQNMELQNIVSANIDEVYNKSCNDKKFISTIKCLYYIMECAEDLKTENLDDIIKEYIKKHSKDEEFEIYKNSNSRLA
ncbi:hypothetical protein TVAG_416720 [Trichomonas vaginalis G3]|uniref:Uncharacterized protein n=1 Tax=Trichomonas vaginalis (strain ATCC PRA-98 / G3) TaxID=412133 RepID=A2EQR4_TRIV3|nr:hypothetical protein TVAGG3_0894090 [Trichomonas vaginalis G3]EAY05029.1 hypothetical protein TVAG_416720 [Trichomonas vaginalis G3]KAI5502930.1 hypothetical protein TVAGG3_0894090 [Trichomonas vaginalis G3]|eukprot:XP_001317252.1 hypothetical protein [Trichomonas vaginalis G3]